MIFTFRDLSMIDLVKFLMLPCLMFLEREKKRDFLSIGIFSGFGQHDTIDFLIN